jgi:hypothetical protein
VKRVLALLFLLTARTVVAQSGSVRTEVDARKIGTDDVTTLSIVLEGDAASLDAALPSLRNLRIVGGPSTSTQISFVNGSMSRQKVLSYVLRAERTGSAEVGLVSVQGYPPTAPITLEVVSGAIRPAQAPQDPFGGRDPFEEFFGRPRRPQPQAQGKVFVDAALSRPAARVGEPILVTYNVYTQVSLEGVEFAEAPKYPGFWAEEIDRSKDDSKGESVVVQGESFLRFPVLERLLFPTRTGLLEIPEARLRLLPSRGMFGIAAPIERSTKVLKVNVNSLPNGTPEGSAVGTYEIDSSVDRSAIALGDAITFRFKVKGRGNLKWVDAAPKLELPGARVFPPRVTSDLKTTRQGIEGSKTWEFVVVPEREGTYEIPAIPFSSFDPATQTLRTDKTNPIPVAVSAAAAAAPATAPRNTTAPVALRADLDRPQLDLSRAVGALAFLSLAAQAWSWRRRPAASTNHGRNKAAIAAALRELRSESLQSATKERAATRIAESLESVFGPRGEWPADDTGDLLRSLSEDLEFLRFAPQLGSYDAKLKEVRDRAAAILEGLQ